jgi:von Willebrand factor type A domain
MLSRGELLSNLLGGRAMRRPTGAIALAFNLMIAVFVVGSLGFVAYEISRILLAREQLTHCLQLAALGGGAEMASTSATGQNAQNLSTTVATFILEKNAILGQSLAGNVVVVSNPAFMQPQPGQVCISYEFDDPVSKQASPTGNVLRVYGTYAYKLFSGGFGSIGVAVYTVMAEANAGLPAMDLEIVYESSSSMDDQTPVTMVRRYWDPTIPAIGYFVPPNNGGPLQQGPLGGLVCSPLIGSAVNGLPPQNLDAVGDVKTTSCPKEFSETGQLGKTVPLRGVTNSSNPPGDAPPGLGGVGLNNMTVGPGNTQDSFAFKVPKIGPSRSDYWLHYLAWKISNFHLEQPAEAFFTPNGFDAGSGLYNPWGADPTMFTDIVVNINGQNAFTSFTGPGAFGAYPFPTLDYLVEASRGNMEGFNPAPSTHPTQAIGSAAQPGYQQAYQLQAYKQLQPKITFESAIKNFMSKLQQTSDCHFGLVAFNNRAGLSPTDTDTAFNVSWAYPVAGKVNYLIPQVPLDPANNNFAAITAILTPAPMGGPVGNPAGGPGSAMFVPNGGSNLADGLQQALNNLTSRNSRTGSMKAIVVVTDKVPTRDLKGNIYSNPAANAPALDDALAVAAAARTQGIPIFMVTIDQSANAQMTSFITTQFSDTAPGGLVSTAGSGGVLYVNNWTGAATTYTSLVGSFNNVVRQLMTLVQGGGSAAASAGPQNGGP